jgi:hypothetical protein
MALRSLGYHEVGANGVFQKGAVEWFGDEWVSIPSDQP